ncbi:MAG: ACT domain-containing protein [Bacillota bacterium]|nr:ACT domain-containing protein [Bacillota bacterium]
MADQSESGRIIRALEEHLEDKDAEESRIVVTVIGRDRVGIIARITSVLAGYQVNILDINQTLFRDLFAMNMVADISRATASFAQLKRSLEEAGAELGVKVYAQREEVFRFMHRI